MTGRKQIQSDTDAHCFRLYRMSNIQQAIAVISKKNKQNMSSDLPINLFLFTNEISKDEETKEENSTSLLKFREKLLKNIAGEANIKNIQKLNLKR
jgi:hypothetical protein